MFSRLICSITVEYFDPWFAYSMEIEKKQKTTTFCSRHHATTSLAEFEVFVAHPETGIELSGRQHKTHSCSVLLNNLAVCLFETNSFCQFSCLIVFEACRATRLRPMCAFWSKCNRTKVFFNLWCVLLSVNTFFLLLIQFVIYTQQIMQVENLVKYFIKTPIWLSVILPNLTKAFSKICSFVSKATAGKPLKGVLNLCYEQLYAAHDDV